MNENDIVMDVTDQNAPQEQESETQELSVEPQDSVETLWEITMVDGATYEITTTKDDILGLMKASMPFAEIEDESTDPLQTIILRPNFVSHIRELVTDVI